MATNPNAAGWAAEVINLAINLRQDYLIATYLLQRYNDTDLASIVNALPNNADNVPETPFDKEAIIGIVTVLDLFTKLLNGEPVARGVWRQRVNETAAFKGLAGFE